MIVVTGGAGFIGSNLVSALNAAGRGDIIVVDDLRDGHKFVNLVDCAIADYFDRDNFLHSLMHDPDLPRIDAILHQGACSDTTEWDGRYMMRNNFEYSKALLHYSLRAGIPFLYASSAATYGAGPGFSETPECETPLNVYGYSKLLFDQYVRRVLPKASSQIVGLRYFNVYGPREQHKARMASVVFHCNRQILDGGEARLFVGNNGYGDGEQRRDFVYVGDVAAVNLWLLENPAVSGIFNVGSGKSRSFNALARAVIDWHGQGEIRYIPFPDTLADSYQSYTEADMTALRAAGYTAAFQSLEDGVRTYLDVIGASRHG